VKYLIFAILVGGCHTLAVPLDDLCCVDPARCTPYGGEREVGHVVVCCTDVCVTWEDRRDPSMVDQSLAECPGVLALCRFGLVAATDAHGRRLVDCFNI